MAIRKYTRRDYPMIAQWYRERGKIPPTQDILSDLGFIADERVAGWIYLTNSSLAMIENVISNPQTIPSLRKESLRRLCSTLVESAMTLGFNNIFAISNHPSIEKICKDLGFRSAAFKVYTLADNDLTGPLDEEL